MCIHTYKHVHIYIRTYMHIHKYTFIYKHISVLAVKIITSHLPSHYSFCFHKTVKVEVKAVPVSISNLYKYVYVNIYIHHYLTTSLYTSIFFSTTRKCFCLGGVSVHRESASICICI